MSVKSRLFTPTLTFLSDHNKDKIHQAALKILAQIGMKILHDQALELLRKQGFDVRMPVRLPCNDAALSFGQAAHVAGA